MCHAAHAHASALQGRTPALSQQAITNLVISDGSRFTAIRMTKSMRALDGRSVVISRDSGGGLVVRHDPHRGLGI
jgi:hypothetical protein